jgi:hypothetical protein
MSETQVITIITALIPLYPFLFALAAALFKWLITKLPKDRQAEVNQVVQTVVQGVEQFGAGLPGPQKKQKAVDMIDTILNSMNITVSPALTNAMIEAAVYTINQSQSPTPTVTVNQATADQSQSITLPTVPVSQAVQLGNGFNAALANG